MRTKLIVILSALLTALAIHDAHAQTGGGFPPAVKPIICTASCSGAAIKPGQTLFIINNSGTETRTSTVTLTVSTIFAVTNLPAGNYYFSANFQWGESGGGGGFLGAMQFGGGCSSGPGAATYYMANQVKGEQNGALGVTSAADNFAASGFIIALSSFELNLCWAQNVSSANTTQINTQGGNIAITRMN